MSKVEWLVEELKKDPIVQKNLYKHTWVSGCVTVVQPITVWKNCIVLQWNSDSQVYGKFIARIVRKYSDIIEDGRFNKSDGSCPSTITFWLKQPVQKRTSE